MLIGFSNMEMTPTLVTLVTQVQSHNWLFHMLIFLSCISYAEFSLSYNIWTAWVLTWWLCRPTVKLWQSCSLYGPFCGGNYTSVYVFVTLLFYKSEVKITSDKQRFQMWYRDHEVCLREQIFDVNWVLIKFSCFSFQLWNDETQNLSISSGTHKSKGVKPDCLWYCF